MRNPSRHIVALQNGDLDPDDLDDAVEALADVDPEDDRYASAYAHIPR